MTEDLKITKEVLGIVGGVTEDTEEGDHLSIHFERTRDYLVDNIYRLYRLSGTSEEIDETLSLLIEVLHLLNLREDSLKKKS